jgi:hypothetical protein
MSTQHPEPLDYAMAKPSRPFQAWEPWGITLAAILAVCVGVVVYEWFRGTGRTRAPSQRLLSMSNPKSIGQACLLYSNDFHYQRPPDQAAMVIKEDIGAECFVHYRSNTVVPIPVRNSRDVAAEAAWVRAYSDYEYLGGGLDIRMIPEDLIVAYERHLSPADAADGRVALFGDGHVEWLMKKDFDAQLARTQSRLTAMRMGSMWLRVGRW